MTKSQINPEEQANKKQENETASDNLQLQQYANQLPKAKLSTEPPYTKLVPDVKPESENVAPSKSKTKSKFEFSQNSNSVIFLDEIKKTTLKLSTSKGDNIGGDKLKWFTLLFLRNNYGFGNGPITITILEIILLNTYLIFS